MKRFLFYTSFFLFFFQIAQGQRPDVLLTGKVKAKDGEAIAQASIYIKHTKFNAVSAEDGAYILRLHSGDYEVTCSALGYEAQSTKVHIRQGEQRDVSFTLKPDARMALNEVEVVGKSAIKEVRESPYNVVALDAKSLYNSTLDLGHMLDKASGVKIRETGGTGSNMSVFLNGFTGRHVKLFMDGVPMEGFGSAFQLNNIPVNIADRIEIYKGVVPIEFGADAMGGVINIVTNQSANSYLDASYSYGSFNTHKSNISLGHTTQKGFTFQLNAFQNYSDNDYKVFTTVQYPSGNQEDEWVRRFHDTYHNETIMAKIGFVRKPWADRFLLGVTLGQEHADIQHANLMRIVFGQKERRATTILPSLSYEKKDLFVKNLNLRFTANYNSNKNENIDTAARQYNWLGDSWAKSSRGESGISSLAEFRNKSASATANVSYRINEMHSFSVSDVISGYKRQNTDEVAILDPISAADTIKRENRKNIFGASYRFNYNRRWVTSVFMKHYTQSVTGPIDTSRVSGTSSYARFDKDYHTTGYGIASTYFLRKYLQLKVSWEKAFRLPTENELFGDGVLETGNASLRAENSYNYNLGLTFNKQLNPNHNLYVDVSGYYRDINDYIRRLIDQRLGGAAYSNHGKVSNIGVDAEVRYYYRDIFSLGGNITYQNMRNKEYLVAENSAQLSNVYDDRVPNVPYFFGNTDAAYFIRDLGGKGNVLSLGYSLNFIGQFYLHWESQGDRNTKLELPQQLSHDFNMSYMMKNGRYNIAFEARNFTNEMLYDNYSLQKPGRSFAVKLRYFLVKRH